MIVLCPICGTKNEIPDNPKRGIIYRCGKCGTHLTERAYAKKDIKPIAPFASGNTIARWVIFIFILFVLICVVAIVSDCAQINLLSRMIEGERVTWSEATANDDRQAVIWWAHTILYILTMPAFLTWIYRAHKNLPALGSRHLRYSPGWAVGWFFVPVFAWFRPFQVMREIWKASDPEVTGAVEWEGAPSSPLIKWWWALYLLISIVGNIVLRWGWEEETVQGLLNLTWGFIALESIEIIGAIVTILVVRAVTARQLKKSVQIAVLQPSI